MSAEETRVAALGAYAPRLYITAETVEGALGQFSASGVERKAVPEADEDPLTMAVEAARRALDAGGYDGSNLAYLAFATTTPPMEEEDLTARLASALGARADAATRTLAGSTRAGAQALDAAVDAGPWGDVADGAGVGLVVASDAPRGAPDSGVEQAAGAGAAAVVLGDGPGRVEGRGSHVESYPGTRFRPAGEAETDGLGVTNYDRQAFSAALSGAAEELDTDVDAAAVQSPDGKLPYRATGALGVDAGTIAAGSTVEQLGDTGAASTLVGAASARADGAERVLVAAFGGGAGANALTLDLAGVPAETALEGDIELSYAEYLRRRGEITSGEPEGGGAYVSVPSWQRTTPQRHRLVAGRCPECGALNFPPEGACSDCTARVEYERVQLSGTGRVEATTTISQGGAPPEFVEQQARSGPFVAAVVALDGPDGGSASIPTQVLTGGRDVEIGDPVETTIRRIYEQEDVVRYGFKAQLRDAKR
ncbi:MAG: zinc ribbon domain-containing protein [Haloarculaceae archaeon]